MKKIFLILLISINLFAWEVNTHRAIDREAISKASNLEAFVNATNLKSYSFEDSSMNFEEYGDITYIDYIINGEGNGMSQLGQTFNKDKIYIDLLEAGSILEDAQWPHTNWAQYTPSLVLDVGYLLYDSTDGRFLNHFYNPQLLDGNAIDWAYETENNMYDYTSAMDYFAKGFSKTDPLERRKYQAKMFVSVGHMMHMLNDMNVPAHVRGDIHPFFEPLEKYMKGGADHNQNIGYYIKGNSEAHNLTPSASNEVTPQPNFKAFMQTEAEFTSTNFFSHNTIFKSSPSPNKSNTHESTIWLSPTVEKSYIENTNNTKIAIHIKSYVINALNELHTYSDKTEIVLGNTSVFDGDNSVLEDSGKVLLSHAITNASNFVNYFFRGHIKSEYSSDVLTVTNDSNVSLVASPSVVTFRNGGSFKVYTDDSDGNREFLVDKNITDNIGVKGSVNIEGIATAYKEKIGEIPKEKVRLTVVYSGNIGEEAGVAVSSGLYDLKLPPIPSCIDNKDINPTHGAVEVTLSWGKGENDFDLSLGMPGSVKDVESCQMEHAYVGSEYEIYPGRYPVNVTHGNDSNIIDTISVNISTPGEIKMLKLDTNTFGFNPGHVADIVVKYVDGKPVVELKPIIPNTPVYSVNTSSYSSSSGWGSSSSSSSSSSGSTGGIGSSRYIPSTPCSPAKSCGCVPCEYIIIPYISQALMGPLSGADISLYSADGYRSNIPVYSGKTSEGTDLYSAGLLNIPESTIENIDDDSLYILQIDGGVDVDYDDNMVVDSIFTPNNATLHAVLKGSDLKNLKPKVNIITEIAYQIVREDIISGKDDDEIFETLDDVAGRLLLSKIYPESEAKINHADLLEWLPTVDKPILVVDYTSKIEPIVSKLQANNDIYQDAYNVVYYPSGVVPILKSEIFNVAENTPVGTTIGKVQVVSQGVSSVSEFELLGEDKAYFTIDNDGNVNTQTELDYETKALYSLYVRAKNDEGYSKYTALYVQVQDVVDAPYVVSFEGEQVYANAEVGSKIAQIVFNAGSSAITSMRLEGADASYFSIDINGEITLQKAFEDFFVKKAYSFKVIAVNDAGESMPVSIVINIGDRRDIPTINNLYVYVDENAPEGTVVGVVPVISDGDSPIESFTINDTSKFTIDSNGTLHVAANANLDYESQNELYLSVIASNVIGDSRSKQIGIRLNNLIDTPPTLKDVNITIDKELAVGSVITNILANKGDSAISEFTLSPDSWFEVDLAGNVRVKSSLLGQSDSEFSISATAKNVAGENSSSLHVSLNTTPRVESYTTTVYDNTSPDVVVGKVHVVANGNSIESLELQGAGSEDFKIALDGTLRSATTLKASTQNLYQLSVILNGIYESQVEIRVRDRIIGSVDTSGNARGVTLSIDGTKAYVADNYSGLQIIDISDATSPTIIGSVDTSSQALDVTLSSDGTKAYVVDYSSGLQIIDISDATSPTIIDSVDTSGYAYGVTISTDGTKAYVADHISGLQIIDISDATSPTIIGSVDTPSYALGVTLSTDGTKAYVADHESGLQIMDISDATSPSIIGSVDTPSYAWVIALSLDGTKAYVADYNSGLQIIDISDATSPTIIGSVDTPSYARNVILSKDGTKAYVADYQSGLQIIDISDPSSPSIMASVDTPSYALGVTLSADGTKAYVADYYSGLQIIDISGIDVPEKIPSIKGFTTILEEDSSEGSYVGEVKIYYTGSSGISSLKLTGDGADDFTIDAQGVVRLKNSLNHSVQSTYNLKAVATNEIGDRETDINIRVHGAPEIKDFSKSINSLAKEGTLVGQLDMWEDSNETITDIKLSGDGAENFTIDSNGKIYVGLGAEFHHFVKPQYDLSVIATNRHGSSDASSVSVKVSGIITTVDTPSYAWVIALSLDGTKAYVADDYSGLQIIDISDATSPTIIGSVDTSGRAIDVTLSSDGTKAYVADYDSGLQIIDISDATSPTIIGSVDTSGIALGVTLSSDGTKAYVGDHTSGLQIIDISDATSPTIIGSVDTSGYARDVTLSSDVTKAYVADRDSGLQIIDISDATSPTIIGSVDTSGYALGVTLSTDGTKAYVADFTSGLQIIDISDATSPTIIGSVDTSSQALDVTLSSDGTKAYVGDHTSGLQIIDISDATSPTIIGSVDTPSYAYGVTISTDETKAYVADGGSGLQIIDLIGLE